MNCASLIRSTVPKKSLTASIGSPRGGLRLVDAVELQSHLFQTERPLLLIGIDRAGTRHTHTGARGSISGLQLREPPEDPTAQKEALKRDIGLSERAQFLLSTVVSAHVRAPDSPARAAATDRGSAYRPAVSCFQQPVNPYLPNNTKIYLTIDSTATLKTDNTGGLVDSTGNPIKVGISYNLPSYIDSIIIQVISSSGLTEKDTVFKNISAKKSTDTSWYSFTFSDDGKKTIKAYAFIQQNFKDSGTVQIAIYDKPGIISPQTPHSHPHLSIIGATNISNAQTCNLAVTVQDSNSSQAHTFIIKQDTLPQIISTTAPTFTWTPPSGFTGTSTVFFKVSDSIAPRISTPRPLLLP